MKNKFLKVIFALLLLLTATSMYLKTNTVEASHSWYWWAKKPRTIVLTRPRYIYEIQGTIPRYKNHMVTKKLMPAGTTMKIQHAADYDWIITKSGYANSRKSPYGKFWIITNGKYRWKMSYTKQLLVDKGLLDGSFSDRHFSYKFNWKQLCKLASLNVFNDDYFVTKKDWKNKIEPLIDKWKPATKNY